MIVYVSLCGNAGMEMRNQPFSITLGVAPLWRSGRVSLICIGYEERFREIIIWGFRLPSSKNNSCIDQYGAS